MNQQEVQEAFEQITSKMSWWQRFTGSQFARGISLFVGQMMYVVIQAAEKALGEAFLSTATKRASILASAEDRGYVGRSVTPSSGKIEIKNKSEMNLLIPTNAHYISQNQLVYITKEPISLAINEIKVVDCWQLELVEVNVPVAAEQPYFSVVLPKDITARVNSVDVYVTDGGRRRMLWEKSFMFRAANKDSRVYTEFYKATEQLGVRFGNGINGKIPPAGSTVTLNAWCTDGDTMLLDGQTLVPIDNAESLTDKIEVKTKTTISGGNAAETTEETRMGALYNTPFDDQIVWGSDYRHYIKNHISGLLWLNVWGEGEEENATGIHDVRNINSIFISAHKQGKEQADIEAEIKQVLSGVPDKMNKRFVYRTVNYSPFTITLKAKCPTHHIPAEVMESISTTLENKFGVNADRFPKSAEELKIDFASIKEKDIWATLESTNLLVDYVLTCEGAMTPTMLNDLIYLDLSQSHIEVTY